MSWSHPQQRRAGERNWCLYMLYGMQGQVKFIRQLFPKANLAALELAIIKAQESLKTTYHREPRR